jgi:hypothetical protein
VADGYTFLNPEPLSRAVILWLWIDLAMGVIAVFSSLFVIVETAGVGASLPSDTELASDIPQALVGLAQTASHLVTAFLVLKWIYRTNRNAHSVARGLTTPPNWAIIWFFVPIAFLWKPFQAFRETWQASAGAPDWRVVKTPPILGWWWGMFLVSNLLGQVIFRIAMSAGTLGGMAIAAGFDVAASLLAVPLNLVYIRIVRDLTRMQVVDMTFGDAKPAAA